ncbi:hypothetical protein BDZ85DRAFT_278202 [Elsinoe ampelina]|uniref:Uncharacterized protein n=1 Tax=Elsinoe ampelina TaxID=302913 RepID=A0A6A6GKI7_9PEZI|nr:hypothetical protein BDZ85DRAFT_278202 [Elsinoe ampelina]
MNPFRTPPTSADREKASRSDSHLEEPKRADDGFNPYRRLILILHLCILPCLIPIFVVGALIMFGNKGQPRNMGVTFTLSMAAKSLIFIQYEVLTAHVQRLKRYGGVKAYMILNCIDAALWPGAVGFLVQRLVSRGCTGKNCTYTYVVIAAAAVLAVLSAPCAFITVRNFRYFKRTGIVPE